MEQKDIPRWVNKEVGCLWCREHMDIEEINIQDNNVHVLYQCHNDEACKYFARFQEGVTFSLIYEDYLERYEKFLTDPEQVEKTEAAMSATQCAKM